VLALILVFIPFPGSQLISRIIDTFIALPTFLITLRSPLFTARRGCSTAR
jgi:ABC-type sulfate transport system permease component